MNKSSPDILRLDALESAILIEQDMLDIWRNRVRSDLYKIRAERAKLLSPYEVGVEILVKYKRSGVVAKCTIIHIRPWNTGWGYALETKTKKNNGKLSTAIRTIHSASDWEVVDVTDNI